MDRYHPLNAYRGVYDSFGEAAQKVSNLKPVGYNDADSATWYEGKLSKVSLEDYPALFWLQSAFKDSRSVFEIGGHIGVAYYGFSTVLPYPSDLGWCICDVPSIAEAGRVLAQKREAANLSFVTHPRESEGADILLAFGSLQYIESPTLAETIAGFRVRPRHIIINVTPVYDGPSFYTVQNIGSAHCAYHIFNRRDLVRSLDELGYSLIDHWQKPRAFSVLNHPDKAFDHYSGFYFRAR